MLLSQSSEYAIRAVLFIARNGDDEYVSIGEISGELDISFHFLTKILQKLTRNNILISYRGPHGGIKLARNADQITIMDIVTVIDGIKIFTNCILGLPDCNDAHPCPLHESWVRHRKEIALEFKRLTIKTLVEQTARYGLRISAMK